MSLQTSSEMLKRIGITIACGVAFLVMASVFSPDRSTAEDDLAPKRLTPHNLRNQSRDGSVNPHEGLRSLGVIEGGRYSITIYATDVGPRYTVIDNRSQTEIGTLLTPQQVKQLLPEVDLKSVDFSASGEDASGEDQPLMLAEPRGGV